MNKQMLAIVSLLIFAFIFRIVVAFWSFNYRENTDIIRYRDWVKITYLHGPANTYSTKYLTFGTLPYNLLPGSLYILYSAYFTNLQVAKIFLHLTHTTIQQNQWMNGILIDFFLRLPSIFADLLLGFLIYLLVKDKTSLKKSLLLVSFFLFNPVIFYNSSFWGQMDSLYSLFGLLSLYLIKKEKYIFSIISFFLSIFIKYTLLPLLPFFLIILYIYTKNIKKIFLGSFLSLILYFLLILPISYNPISWILQIFPKNATGELQNITSFAFNFWWIIYKPSIIFGKPDTLFSFSNINLTNAPLSSVLFLGIPLFYYAAAIFFLFCIPIFYFFYNRKQISIYNIFVIFSIVSLLIFVFLPNMHERYIYPFFVFFPLLFTKKMYLSFFYIFLSILNWINLYIVWHPMKLFFMPYTTISNSTFQWMIAFITTVTSLIIYAVMLKILYEKK